MNHAQWKTRRTRQLLGETVESSEGYLAAGDAMALGQAVYDRRKELGLSQQQVAERAGMTQPQVSNIEQAGAEPTLALLRKLAKALDATLSIDLDSEDTTFVFTPKTKPDRSPAPEDAYFEHKLFERWAQSCDVDWVSTRKLMHELSEAWTITRLATVVLRDLDDDTRILPQRTRNIEKALARRVLADAEVQQGEGTAGHAELSEA